jgi:hypothetical protein
MADHDQRFKTLLQEFFAEFMQLFFPDWVARFDLENIEWLNTELFADPPQGERRLLDLVAKLNVRQVLPAQRPGREDKWIALLHVEIESDDKVAPFRPRLFDYFWILQERYNLPVLPIGLYLRVGLQGIGWDVYEQWFWERRLVRFEYPYIGLPALDAEQYVTGENLLGVALSALMRISPDRRAWIKAEALRRLVAAPEKAKRRFLLCECVQAYLPLEGPQLDEFNQLLLTERYAEIQPMATTWFEQGIETGILQGQIRTLRKLIEKRFGPLTPPVLTRLDACSEEELDRITVQLLDARSLTELGLGENQPA